MEFDGESFENGSFFLGVTLYVTKCVRTVHVDTERPNLDGLGIPHLVFACLIDETTDKYSLEYV